MTTIPDDIRRFVLTSIPSVPYLEAALLLRGEERGWTVTEVARRLYITDAAAEELLEALQAGGLARTVAGPAPGYRYLPRDEALARSMVALADCYRENLFGVTTLIHDAIQVFKEGRTTFFITHKMHTVQMADRIVVLENHAVAAIGVHADLIVNSPVYRGLYEAQIHTRAA